MSKSSKRRSRAERRNAARDARIAALAAPPPPPSPPSSPRKFRPKWGDSFALLAVPLTFAGMLSENDLVVGICFALAGAVACAPVIWHHDILVKYKAAYCIAVFALCSVLFFIIRHENMGKMFTRNEGTLEPGNERPPERNCSATDQDTALALYIGPHTVFIRKFPQNVLTIANQDILTLSRDGNKIVVTTLRLYSDRGDIFARIDQNGFWIAPNVRKIRKEKNSLVIFDRNDEEALNIKYINERVVAINGIFRYANRPPVLFKPDFSQIGGVSGKFGFCSPDAFFEKGIFVLE